MNKEFISDEAIKDIFLYKEKDTKDCTHFLLYNVLQDIKQSLKEKGYEVENEKSKLEQANEYILPAYHNTSHNELPSLIYNKQDADEKIKLLEETIKELQDEIKDLSKEEILGNEIKLKSKKELAKRIVELQNKNKLSRESIEWLKDFTKSGQVVSKLMYEEILKAQKLMEELNIKE